ncbi:MAG: rod shape-determining protein MreD, partial [Planctomycetota bacterium]|nr:rod shape-determining protein MreD [Planctomycetota bacterium]
FLFILVFYIAFYSTAGRMRFPSERAFYLVFSIGLIKDALSESVLGTNALLYLTVAIIISLTKGFIFREDIGIQILILLLCVFLYNFLNGLGLYLFYGSPPVNYIVIKSILISLYTIVLGGILLFPLRRVIPL